MSPTLIIFAVQAAVQLAKTGRSIYVENTLRDEIAYPMPDIFSSLENEAENYATTLRTSTDDYQRALHQKDFIGDNGSEKTGLPLEEAYLQHVALGYAVPADSTSLTLVAGYYSIRPYNGNDPFPSPANRIASTLIRIAVDYYVNVSGSINEESSNGKLLKALLLGLKEAKLEEGNYELIAADLFTTALETVGDNPDIVTSDLKDQNLVKTIIGGTAAKLKEKLAGTPLESFDKKDRYTTIGSIVLRSLLDGGARSLVNSPQVLLEKGSDGEQALVTAVGNTFLDLLLEEGDSGKDLGERLAAVASSGGLDKLIKSALKVAVEYPELIKSSDAAKKEWLINIIKDLNKVYGGDKSLFDGELLANIAYSALENGLKDANAFLIREAGLNDEPLAVFVANTVLKTLAVKKGGKAQWDFNLSRSEVVAFVTQTLQALTDNPRWVTSSSDKAADLKKYLPLVTGAVAALDKNGFRVKGLLKDQELKNLVAALLISEAYKKIDNSSGMDEKLSAALKLILQTIEEGGLVNRQAVFSFEFLHDLFKALDKKKALQILIDKDDEAKVAEVLSAVAEITAAFRQGRVMTIVQMTKEINLG